MSVVHVYKERQLINVYDERGTFMMNRFILLLLIFNHTGLPNMEIPFDGDIVLNRIRDLAAMCNCANWSAETYSLPLAVRFLLSLFLIIIKKVLITSIGESNSRRCIRHSIIKIRGHIWVLCQHSPNLS